jgi:thiamine-phosphate pyrophosphorylase
MIRCYVTDRRQGDLLSFVNAAIRDRVDLIQVREKDLDARVLYELVCRVRDAAVGTPTKILVNDRLDVAMAANVDGVHLPAQGCRPREFGRSSRAGVFNPHRRRWWAPKPAPDFVISARCLTPGKTPVGVEACDALRRPDPALAIGGIMRTLAR